MKDLFAQLGEPVGCSALPVADRVSVALSLSRARPRRRADNAGRT